MVDPARLRPLLVHEDADVRVAVADYFADAGSDDPELMTLVLDAYGRYGESSALMLEVAKQFPLTEVTFLRVLALLGSEDLDVPSDMALTGILEAAPVAFFEANEQAVRALPRLEPETIEHLERRCKLASKSGPELWQLLQTLAERAERSLDDEVIAVDRAADVVAALAPLDVPVPAEVCALLADPNVEGGWLEVFLVNLAADRRMREAVPELFRRLRHDDEELVDAVVTALARIGDPAVATRIGTEFDEGEEDFRFAAAYLLGGLKCEESERVALALLASEEDRLVRSRLCIALCRLFSSHALDAGRREAGSDDPDVLYPLLRNLITTAGALGLDLPEKDEWQARGEEAFRAHLEGQPPMDEFDAFDLDGYGDDEDTFEDDPDLDDEIVFEPDYRAAPEPERPIHRSEAKVGRNDPCPCGSGRKYKHCCGRPGAAPAGPTLERPAPRKPGRRPEKAGDLLHVEYRGGLIDPGMTTEDLSLKVWQAPDIPFRILQAIDKDRILDLGGVYGDPAAGEPPQYDYARFVGRHGKVEITFHNRAIELFVTDDETIRRVHRILLALEDTPTEP